MPNAFTLIEHIQNGGYDPLFSRMYTKEQIADQRSRYITAVKAFVEVYGDRDNLFLFSAPGRTEIGGNHTDHNHGRVLAASVNLDVIAVAAPTAEPVVRVQSAGYPLDTVRSMIWLYIRKKSTTPLRSSAACPPACSSRLVHQRFRRLYDLQRAQGIRAVVIRGLRGADRHGIQPPLQRRQDQRR
ncbi:MAG: galactokinase family protein [Acutalibacteraceae bacterium]